MQNVLTIIIKSNTNTFPLNQTKGYMILSSRNSNIINDILNDCKQCLNLFTASLDTMSILKDTFIDTTSIYVDNDNPSISFEDKELVISINHPFILDRLLSVCQAIRIIDNMDNINRFLSCNRVNKDKEHSTLIYTKDITQDNKTYKSRYMKDLSNITNDDTQLIIYTNESKLSYHNPSIINSIFNLSPYSLDILNHKDQGDRYYILSTFGYDKWF